MDDDFDGYCDWADFIAYLLYELHSKENLLSPDQQQQLELPINETTIVLPSRHRHPIIAVLFRPYINKDRTWDYDNGKYMTVSTDGALNIWSLDFELEKSQYAFYPKEAKVQKTVVTSVVCLTDANLICMATRERDLRFYDISLGNFHLKSCIVGLHQTVTALHYHFYQDEEKPSVLIGGDLVGNILFLKLKTKSGGPFRTLTQTSQNGFVIIKIASLEHGQIQGIKFKMFEGFQSDWIHQIEWFPEISQIVSCQNKSKNSLIAFDPSSKEIKMKFSIPKGVNVFCIVKDSVPMRYVTGGYDSAIRVWDHMHSFEPLAVLHGHHTPIAAIIVQNKGTKIYSLSIEKIFKVWDVKQKACIMTVPGKLSDLGKEIPFTCFYNPVYRRFIAANYKINLLRLGHEINHYYSEGFTHVAGATKALFNPIFKCVVTVGMDSNILTWNPYNGKRIHMIRNAHTKEQYGETKAVGITSATFGPSLIHLLTGAVDGSVKMWNFSLGICLRDMLMKKDCCVTGLYWIPQRLLAMGWNKHVTEWVDEVEIGDSKNWPMYHTEDITASAIFPPNIIATGTYSGELIFLKLKNGQPFKIHFVGVPNLDNRVGFAVNRGIPLNLRSSFCESTKEKNIFRCHCLEEKKCDCEWMCPCLENCDCKASARCKCDQTVFFYKEGKEMEDLESMFEGLVRRDKEPSKCAKSPKLLDSKKKKKKPQSPIITGTAGRMEIHTMYFLTTRGDNLEEGSLLASLQNGWVQLWSSNPEGGLVSTFYAIHVVGDYVTDMIANADNSFLFTGHAFGYVKIWHISNFGRAGPPIKRSMPVLRLMFPFLIKDKIPGRAKRAAKGQSEPVLLSSCRNHVSKVSHIELIEVNQIYITCGLDKAVRFWTYGGQYIGTLGGCLPWPKIPPDAPFKPWPHRIPPDLKRVVSSTSLKVLTDCYAKEVKYDDKSNKTDLFSSDDDDEKRYKKVIEARELKHKIYPDSMKKNVLGQFFKLTDLKVTVKPPPKLNLQDPVLRVLNLMKTTEMDPVRKPKTPPYASREDCQKNWEDKMSIMLKQANESRGRSRSKRQARLKREKQELSKNNNHTRKHILARLRSQSKKRLNSKKKSAAKKHPLMKKQKKPQNRKRSRSVQTKFRAEDKLPPRTQSILHIKHDQKRVMRILRKEVKKNQQTQVVPFKESAEMCKWKMSFSRLTKNSQILLKEPKKSTDITKGKVQFKVDKKLEKAKKLKMQMMAARKQAKTPTIIHKGKKSPTQMKRVRGLYASSYEIPDIVKLIKHAHKNQLKNLRLNSSNIGEIIDYLLDNRCATAAID
ncbi:WD repeat-containing protein on Y chromosome isoform X2 [Cimex lectularius]|nr:WD repeat-containing protein on Y chromosome isoform X2 [Cimex lectularius]